MKGINQKRKNSELPAGTQFRMPKKADDRTRPVPFQPQCVKIKAVLRMALDLLFAIQSFCGDVASCPPSVRDERCAWTLAKRYLISKMH